jgi:hypothetical protein
MKTQTQTILVILFFLFLENKLYNTAIKNPGKNQSTKAHAHQINNHNHDESNPTYTVPSAFTTFVK